MQKLVITTLTLGLTLCSTWLFAKNTPTETKVGKDVKINFKVNGGIANTITAKNGKLCVVAGGISQANIKGNAKLNFKVNGAVANTVSGKNGSMSVVLGGVGQGVCQ